MTVKEMLEKADDKTILHIGAVDGYGWMFVGTKAECYRDAEIVDRVNLQPVLDRAEFIYKKMERLRYNLERLEEGLNAKHPDKWAYKCKRFKKFALGNAEYINKECHKLKGIEEQIDAYIPFLDREVIDGYKRMLGGVGVLIAGDEGGKYWTLNEYRNGVAEDEDEN